MIERAGRDSGAIPGLVETATAIGRAHSVLGPEALVTEVRGQGGDVAKALADALSVDSRATRGG